ncbi:hypothetical protein MXB_2516 [Myxobolus squamalis]|nr:hypothetical protein MXB_2516 [Myxobolus squamalis]
MSSRVISDVIGKFDYESGNGKVNVLLATAITLFPLLIDNVFNDSVYMCPTRNRRFYSVFLMLAPSTCAIVLGLIMTAQYFRNHDELGPKEVIRKLLPRLFIMLIIICITFGSSFIFSKYYVCYHLDPTVKDDILMAHLINESRQIGWIIILSGLMLLFFITLLQFTLFYPSKLERTWNSYKMMQYKSANEMLKETLLELAKNTVSKELSRIIKEIDELNEFDEERVSDLIRSYHRVEKKMLRDSEKRGAQLLKFQMKNSQVPEEKQYLLHTIPEEDI